jgi:hypothetical protein
MFDSEMPTQSGVFKRSGGLRDDVIRERAGAASGVRLRAVVIRERRSLTRVVFPHSVSRHGWGLL